MKALVLALACAMSAAATSSLNAQERDSSRTRLGEVIVRTRSTSDTAGQSRAVLGVSTQSSGARDSLGLLIVNVTPGGPADRAGLQEGDRIMSVNDVNLKLAPADAGQPDMRGLTTRRLVREMEKVKAGNEVRLSVYANGTTKIMTVKTARAGDVYKGETGRGFRFYFGGEEVPPVPPVPAVPRVGMDEVRVELDRVLPRVRADLLAAREALRDSERRVVSVGRGMLSLRGLDLVRVNPDLASYFGKESEKGLLITRADSSWSPLRPGDVILSVNGEPVRDDDRITLSLDRSRENRVEILRKGKKEGVVVKAVASRE
jgi:S1-C subfamily serine protease